MLSDLAHADKIAEDAQLERKIGSLGIVASRLKRALTLASCFLLALVLVLVAVINPDGSKSGIRFHLTLDEKTKIKLTGSY